MTAATTHILQSIGNTSLIQLRRIVPVGSAQVFAKLEWQNPTGSMKDRMALGVIAKAEQDGRLRPGGTVIEYTGGSTGASLALVCAAKGYNSHVVSSHAFSQEKLDHMVAYGAKLTLVPYAGGGATKQMFLDMIECARQLSTQPNTYWVNQLNNPDTIPGYYPMGEEIWEQMSGEIDAFVHSVGTFASLHAVATVLKRHNPRIRIIAVEPEESSVLGGGPPGAHDIEGIGVGFMPPLWKPDLVDEVLSVKTEAAKEMARELARKEAIFTGTSSGGNVHAALRVARQLGPKARIATLMIDSGLKYLSTDVYRSKAER
jgi:cysteine synthase A